MFVGAVSERLCMVVGQMIVEPVGALPINPFDYQGLFKAISQPPAV
jgi:hypothetical protein